MQLLGGPQQRLGVRSVSAPKQTCRPSVVTRFFKSNKRQLGSNDSNFTRKQYEETIGGFLQTATSAPAEAEESAPAPAPEQHNVNGHSLHVVKPQQPTEAAPAEESNGHAAEAAVQGHAVSSPDPIAELAVAEPKLEQPPAAEKAETESAKSDAAAAEPAAKVQTVQADEAAGSVFKHIGKAAEAAQQEGRVLKPAKARTEPKTPAAASKKVPQAANPRNLVFVTAEVCCSAGVCWRCHGRVLMQNGRGARGFWADVHPNIRSAQNQQLS